MDGFSLPRGDQLRRISTMEVKEPTGNSRTRTGGPQANQSRRGLHSPENGTKKSPVFLYSPFRIGACLTAPSDAFPASIFKRLFSANAHKI